MTTILRKKPSDPIGNSGLRVLWPYQSRLSQARKPTLTDRGFDDDNLCSQPSSPTTISNLSTKWHLAPPSPSPMPRASPAVRPSLCPRCSRHQSVPTLSSKLPTKEIVNGKEKLMMRLGRYTLVSRKIRDSRML